MPTPKKNNSEYPKDLKKEEEDALYTDDNSEVPPSDIVAFNELRSCADLFRMEDKKQLIIQPDFQRDVVWSTANQTRFIDSLLKQLPIPSMCISLDYKNGNRLVIDGLQRMSSIIRFLKDDEWKLATLDDIDQRLSGKKISYVKSHYKKIVETIENTTLPITVLRCDYSKSSHMEYLFTIFHRLNTGGNKLSNQEIRNCIFYGKFNDLLKECVKNAEFRHLFNLKKGLTYRFKYEEFILRVFAYNEMYEKYTGNLSKFLNEFMKDADKSYDTNKRRELLELFTKTTNLIYDKLLEGSELPDVSIATSEALFVACMRNSDHLSSKRSITLKRKLQEMRGATEFLPENLRNAITTKQKVIDRMNKAIEIFSKV